MNSLRFLPVLLSLCFASSWAAPVTTQMTPGAGGKIVVEATGVAAPVPVFFTGTADQAVRVAAGEITGETKLTLRVVQGAAEVFTLGLVGDGEVVSVSGAGLRDWSVRSGTGEAAGKRFLDLRPAAAAAAGAETKSLDVVVRTRLRDAAVPGKASVLLVTTGDAVGFSSRVRVSADAAVEVRLARAEGVIAVDGAPVGALDLVVRGEPVIELALARRGAVAAEAELTAVQLTGAVNAAAGSVDFRLKAQARVSRE